MKSAYQIKVCDRVSALVNTYPSGGLQYAHKSGTVTDINPFGVVLPVRVTFDDGTIRFFEHGEIRIIED